MKRPVDVCGGWGAGPGRGQLETPPLGPSDLARSSVPRGELAELRKQTESPELPQGRKEEGASPSHLHPVKFSKGGRKDGVTADPKGCAWTQSPSLSLSMWGASKSRVQPAPPQEVPLGRVQGGGTDKGASVPSVTITHLGVRFPAPHPQAPVYTGPGALK